jgi:DnaK suppressor protein
MTTLELKQMRRKLQELESRLQGDIRHLTVEMGTDPDVTGSSNNLPVKNREELASQSYGEDVTVGLLELEIPELDQIRAAYDRIDNGIYGRCEDCHVHIPFKRLLVVPFAQRCVPCARKTESETATTVTESIPT